MVGLNRGELAGVRILSPEAYDEMWQSSADTGLADWEHYGPPLAGYGLGWFVGQIEDHVVVGHPGGDLGFNSQMILVPDKDMALVAATNLFNGDDMYAATYAAIDIMYALLDAEEEPRVEPAQAALDSAMVAEIEGIVEERVAK